MKNKLRQKGEQQLRYNMKIWKKGVFDIINYIGKNVTLAQLMDPPGNINHAIVIIGYCIFDSNYKQELFLKRESLDLICYPSVGEEQVVKSETVFYDVRYMCSPGNLNIG